MPGFSVVLGFSLVFVLRLAIVFPLFAKIVLLTIRSYTKRCTSPTIYIKALSEVFYKTRLQVLSAVRFKG